MICTIKDALKDNPDKLIELLNKLNCDNPHTYGKREIRFGHIKLGTTTDTSNRIYIDTLGYKSFSCDSQGDIITLVGDIMDLELGSAIKWLADYLGIKVNYIKKEVHKPFGGFWSNLSKTQQFDDTPPLTYPLSRLDEYLKGGNLLWVKDNIDLKTQEKFNVMLDVVSSRYLIPWFDVDGSLVGIVGRYSEREVPDRVPKYLSLIPMNKSKVVFGLNYNYKNILNDNILYVFESEKSTMLLDSYGLPLGGSIGSKTISERQARLIKSMFCDVVLCYDEDVTEEELIQECKKLVMKNPFTKTRVGYIYDREKKYMKKGSKCSPIDNGMEIFCNLLSECLVWINE